MLSFSFVNPRLWIGPDVQWRICVGESPSSGGLQAATGKQLWHSGQLIQKATTIIQEDGHRYGPGNGHVQAHESVGRPQDNGGDEEGGRVWCFTARQLSG